MTRIRILRVIEYVGDAAWVYGTLHRNAVKGELRFGDNVIREATIGNLPEILEQQTKGE